MKKIFLSLLATVSLLLPVSVLAMNEGILQENKATQARPIVKVEIQPLIITPSKEDTVYPPHVTLGARYIMQDRTMDIEPGKYSVCGGYGTVSSTNMRIKSYKFKNNNSYTISLVPHDDRGLTCKLSIKEEFIKDGIIITEIITKEIIKRKEK
ncbi:MAG: hypothetical protein KBD90_05510 [Alphaproteobacteria bacterium]|nr:hypothetical protein [Alphaproteobacteria bacterium]